jgi:hypothetical protein
MNRDKEVRRLRATGMSYGRIAAALKMSKRDVSRILSGTSTTVPTTVPVTATVPTTVPVQSNNLPRFTRRLSSEIDNIGDALSKQGWSPYQVTDIIKPLRRLLLDMQIECPDAEQTLDEKLAGNRAVLGAAAVTVAPGVDPLALL